MPSRRAYLAASVGTFAALAGCRTRPSEIDTPTDTGPPNADDRSGSPDGTLDVAGAWPQKGFDPGHTGATTAAGVPTDGRAVWHHRRVRSGPPVLADGRLYHFGRVGKNRSGTPTPTPTRVGTRQPLEGDRAVFCRDARTGRLCWTRPVVPRQRWPAVANGRVLIAGEGFLTAYRTRDGEPSWRRDLGDRYATVEAVLDDTLLVSTQLLREENRDPDVRAYRVRDGTRRWSRSAPKWQPDVAAADGTVYSLSARFQDGSVLTARRLDDGRERWTVEIDGNGIPGGPIATADTAYVMPDDGGVSAFRRSDGRRRWHYAAETPNVVGVAVDAATARAYLLDDGTLRVLDATTGRERSAMAPSGDRGFAGVPAVGADAVYLEKGGFPADLVVLSRTDGTERWAYTLPETTVEGDIVTSGVAAQPVVAGGAVYAYAADGLYAFGPA